MIRAESRKAIAFCYFYRSLCWGTAAFILFLFALLQGNLASWNVPAGKEMWFVLFLVAGCAFAVTKVTLEWVIKAIHRRRVQTPESP